MLFIDVHPFYSGLCFFILMQQREIMPSSNSYPLVNMLLILALAGPYSLVKASYASDAQESSGSDVRYSPPHKQNRHSQTEDSPDMSPSSASSDQNPDFPSPPSDRTNRVNGIFTNRITELKENLQRHLETTANLLLTLQSIDMEELEDNQRFIKCASKFLPSFGYSRHLKRDEQNINQTNTSTAIPVSALQQNKTFCLPGQDCGQDTYKENIISSTPNTPQFSNPQRNQTLMTKTISTTTTTRGVGSFFPPRPNFPSSPNFPAPGRTSSLTNVDKDNLEKIGDTPVRAEESLKVFREHLPVEEYVRLMENRPQLPPQSGPNRPLFAGKRKKSFSTSCGSYQNCLHILTSLQGWKK